MGYFEVSDELQHHGIKGQKWGVRRFQNKDGSLKPSGQKRYSIDHDRRGRQVIVDQNGKKMSGSDRRFMEKAMKKDLKSRLKDDKEARTKYAEYKRAKRDSKQSYTYVGNDMSAALMTMALNSATASTVQNGKEKVDRMVAEYANKYLDELSKNA